MSQLAVLAVCSCNGNRLTRKLATEKLKSETNLELDKNRALRNGVLRIKKRKSTQLVASSSLFCWLLVKCVYSNNFCQQTYGNDSFATLASNARSSFLEAVTCATANKAAP